MRRGTRTAHRTLRSRGSGGAEGERESVGRSDGVEKNAKPFCPGLRVGLVAPKQPPCGRVRARRDGEKLEIATPVG